MLANLFPTRENHRIKNLHIARAATEISRQTIANVCFRGIRISFEQIHGGHHHARRADAALCSTAINERLLNRVQLFAARDAFDRFDGRAFNLRNRNQTTVHNPAIDEDRTRATLAFAATFLRTRQMKLLAQHVEQTFHWESLKRSWLAVDGAVDWFFCVDGWHSHFERLLLPVPNRKHIMLSMFDWGDCQQVERSEGRLSGAWVFRGTRVPVRALFENLETGATIDEFLEWFPGVTLEQVVAVLAHAEHSLAEA